MAEAARYDEVAIKASHNTFHIDAPLTTLTPSGEWEFPVYDAGCRAIELDVAQYGGPGPGRFMQWSVQHDDRFELHNRQLSQFLAELRAWSRSNAGHDVVTVLICLKGVARLDEFPAQLDTYLSRFLCDGDLSVVYRPGDLLGRAGAGAGDLRTATRSVGWPVLDELRGRFILIMSGEPEVLEAYAAAPEDRLGFACVDCDDDRRPPADYVAGKPNQIFLNYHLFGDHRRQWASNLAEVRDDPSILVRGFLVQKDWWDDAVAAGVNLLATDAYDRTWPEPFLRR
jgi:hypothetical protein